MAQLLSKRGASPIAALFAPFPPRYAHLEPLAQWDQWDDALKEQVDSVVILDTCSNAQLEPVANFLVTAPPVLVVDHHATRDTIATRACDLRVLDETASATCLLVAELVRALGTPFDTSLATALFTGMATDTGWFAFQNTDARTLRMAAELVEAGADAPRIYRGLYQQDSVARLRLVGRMLSQLRVHADGRVAVLGLRMGDFQAAGANMSMTEDLINEAVRLAGVEAVLLFTEEPEIVRVNFRSRDWLDVARLAQQFGGGGHVRAAGARVRGAWDDVVSHVLATTEQALADGPAPRAGGCA
jgi:phosphoesterase RecJ-like protein